MGSFDPPHLGHIDAIEKAGSQVDRLIVVLDDGPTTVTPALRRAEWLADSVPDATFIIASFSQQQEWAERAHELAAQRPTRAFIYEEKLTETAERLGVPVEHIVIDSEEFPVSERELRSNLREHYTWLVPAARASFAKRVTLAGAESTGKSTLAIDLAHHYQTTWVPEYGRWYTDGRVGLKDRTWTADEFVRIAVTHHQGEEDLARRSANGLVILDTDALVTKVWHRRYLDSENPPLEKLVDRYLPDLYFVCAPDFAWVHDGTRESPDYRHDMHLDTLHLIEATGVPYVELTGDAQKRLKEAIGVIDETIQSEPLI